MSSDKCNRHKLTRINATTEEPSKCDAHTFALDQQYSCIPSTGSSKTTPSQGSSSQETNTIIDGDKTPVNESQTYYGSEILSCPTEFSEPMDRLRKRVQPLEKLYLPIDHRSDSSSKGMIEEPFKANFTRFASDAVQRSTHKDAAILPRDEWRTLNRDLRNHEQFEYYKGMAQEEGGEGDIQDGGLMRLGITQGLDDEAEEYAFETGFPDVVESLFSSLDTIKLKGREIELSTAEVLKISRRFDKLSNVFKTDHDALPHREKQSHRDLDIAQNRMNEITTALKTSIENMKEIQSTGDMKELLHSMEQNSQEMQHHSNTLTKKAKEVGAIDIQKRVYKMIEVMVLYVHILRNFEKSGKEPISAKKAPHSDTESPSSNSNGTVGSNYKNHLNKGGWTEGYLDESHHRMERWLGESYEFLRRELSWPWNWEQTWKGVKQGFSILLMLAGLFIIFRSVFPIVSANGIKR